MPLDLQLRFLTNRISTARRNVDLERLQQLTAERRIYKEQRRLSRVTQKRKPPKRKRSSTPEGAKPPKRTRSTPAPRPVILAFVDKTWSRTQLRMFLMTLPAGSPVVVLGINIVGVLSFSSDGTLDVDAIVRSVGQAARVDRWGGMHNGVRFLKLLAAAASALPDPLILTVFSDQFMFNKCSLIQLWRDTMKVLRDQTSGDILSEISYNFRHQSLMGARVKFHTTTLSAMVGCMDQLGRPPSHLLWAESLLGIRGAGDPATAVVQLTQGRAHLPKDLLQLVIYLANMGGDCF